MANQRQAVLVGPVNRPVKFYPQFSLESQDGAHEVFPDHVMPLAMVAIRQRNPNRVFLNTVEMTRKRFPSARPSGGWPTWEDIDPKITLLDAAQRPDQCT